MTKTILGLLFICPSLSIAAGPSFTNLSQSDFQAISQEVSSNFSFTSTSGASAAGPLWTFETAFIGGVNPSPNTDTIVQNSAPGNSMPNLYQGGVLFGLVFPAAITGELIYLPKVSSQGAEIQFTSISLKWSPTEDLLAFLPVNIAVRGLYNESQFNFDQTSSGVNGTIHNKNTLSGAQLLLSPKMPFFEPYIGFGYLQAKDSLSVNGTGTVFNSSYTSSQQADESPVSAQFLAGLEMKISMIKFGLEYSKAFGANRYTTQFGFNF